MDNAYRFSETDGDVIKRGKTVVDAFDNYLLSTFIVETIKEFSLNVNEGTYNVVSLDGETVNGKVTEEL